MPEYWLIKSTDKKLAKKFQEQIFWIRPANPKDKNSKMHHGDSPSYMYWGKNWKILERVTVEDDEQLDWKKTSTYKNLVNDSTDSSLKIGWLSPEGKMHYCEYQNHISFVHAVLEKDVPTIEKKGWMHIMEGDGRRYYSKNNGKRLTVAQAKWLQNEGDFYISEEDIGSY